MQTTKELEESFSAGTYIKRDLCLERGEGVRVYDEKGKRYLDCIGGIGTSVLGHAHPALVEAISSQASQIISAPELLCTPKRAEYQKAILEHFPEEFHRVFLCSSGAESVEAALKFSRFSTEKPGILALKRGFHGKTLGSLSATAEDKYRAPFAPLLPELYHTSSSDIDAFKELLNEHSDKIGCFLFEAVQGEGGVRQLDKEFIQEAVSIAQNAGLLVIADEVQCGFGRTGKMWGFEHVEVEPDIVCMAKGIAGGVPMGAVAIGSRVKELMPQSHTSTFGGNPLACAAALAVLQTMNSENLAANAHKQGKLIRERITAANLKRVREIRGLGLMLGIELKERAGKYISMAMDKGLLCLLAGPRVIRLLPPLIINEEEAAEAADTLIEVLQ